MTGPARQLRVGDEIPAWTRTTSIEHWNRFASVNDEFVGMHMDDQAGRRAGNTAFGMGNLRYAYMLNALRGWLGDALEVRRMDCQFRAVNQRDDTLTVRGRVTAVTEDTDGQLVSLDIDVVNQRGESTSPGHAVVALPIAREREGSR